MTIIAAVDWPTIASLATALGTLILAIATFGAVRSANRAARTAERSLLAGLRPVLFASRDDDPPMRVTWIDRQLHVVPGGRAVVDVTDEVIYMAMNLRNVGAGIAVLHGWYVLSTVIDATTPPEPTDDFRRLTRDLYIPPGGTGFWQGAIRDVNDPDRAAMLATMEEHGRVAIDLLYGDVEGGQRTVSRFSFVNQEDEWRADVVRHWHLDNPDPR